MSDRDSEAACSHAGDPAARLAGGGRTLVLAIGNRAAGDDAFGPAVLQALEGAPLPPGVELADGGILGIDLLSELEGLDRLILVDAVRARGPKGSSGGAPDDFSAADTSGVARDAAHGGARAPDKSRERGLEPGGPDFHESGRAVPVPGEVVVFRPGEVGLEDPDPRFSLHDLSFGGCLRLARLLDLRLPDIVVVGYVLPSDPAAALGSGSLSGAAGRAVPEAVSLVRSLLSRAGA